MGIAIGGIAIIGVAVAVWFVMSRRRKEKPGGQVTHVEAMEARSPPPVYRDSMLKGPMESQQMYTQPAEVHANSYVPPAELGGSHVAR